MDIEIWTTKGKRSVNVNEIISVTANKTDFLAECSNTVFGEVNLDNLNIIFDLRPKIVDEKALELKKTREILKSLFTQ